jgi:hypothetical protein
MPKKERGTERGERERRNRRNTRISKKLLPVDPRVMAEHDWTPSTIMPSHLQNLVKQGFMIVVELMACHVSEDPVFPMPIEGYVVSFVVFYERGFSTPSHQFLRTLLWYYDLELHHMTPLGVLHIVAFVTLCEAFLGIDPKFDL